MEDPVYLLSGTSRYLYKNDIYRTMALPPGYVVTYRYRDTWVHPDIENPKSSLEDGEAILTAVSASGWGIPEYYPLRKGEISSVHIEEEAEEQVVYVHATLKDEWPNYEELNECDSRPLRVLDDHHSPSDNQRYYVFESGYRPGFKQSNGAWRDIVKTLSKNGDFKNSLFYKIGCVRDIDETNSCITETDPISHSDTDVVRRGYALDGEKNYSLEILFDFGSAVPDNAEASYLNVTSTEFINLFPRDIRLGFKLDKRELRLSTKGISERSIEYVSFSLEGEVEGADFEMPFVLKGKVDDDG